MSIYEVIIISSVIVIVYLLKIFIWKKLRLRPEDQVEDLMKIIKAASIQMDDNKTKEKYE